jgi:hypothetical protein
MAMLVSTSEEAASSPATAGSAGGIPSAKAPEDAAEVLAQPAQKVTKAPATTNREKCRAISPNRSVATNVELSVLFMSVLPEQKKCCVFSKPKSACHPEYVREYRRTYVSMPVRL